MDLQKNKVYRAELVDYTTDGSAVARIGGMAVFVPFGAVGDQCDIKILKVNKHVAYGKIEKIIVSSKHRVEPECPYTARCGGCCWWHVVYQEELRAKRKKVEDAIKRIGGIELAAEEIIPSPLIYHYRNKAQYPVGRDDTGIITGFYRPRSHDIISVEHCLIQSEQADILTKTVRGWMHENGVSPYQEKTGNGFVRHIFVRLGFKTGQVQLCLVSKSAKLPALHLLVEYARQECPGLVSVLINVNKKPGNRILGDKTVVIWGQDYLEDKLCGNRFRISPKSFYQVNQPQAEALYQCVLDYAALDQNLTALDLYCGVGTITLALAKAAKSVIGVEAVPDAVKNAKENAEYNMISNAEFLCADAGQAAQMLIEQGARPDVIVVDPPRKGLDSLAVDAILQMNPKKIVYVSCDPATLARDSKAFTEQGYCIDKYKVFDLFPRTSHVETVCLLSKPNA